MAKKCDIYAFKDYRSYLDAALKAKTSGRLSYRSLAKKAGFSNSNHFQLIIAKKRHLTPATAEKVADCLGLVGYERKYFAALVRLELATTKLECQLILKELEVHTANGAKHEITDEHFFSTWIHGVIWTLAEIPDFDLSPENIQKTVRFHICTDDINKSLDFHLSRGYLKPTNKLHRYRQGDLAFDPLNDRQSLDLRQVHMNYLKMAANLVDDPMSEREYQYFNMPVPKSKVVEMKRMVRQFMDELYDSLDQEALDADQVIHVQFAAFKLTN